MAGLYAALGLIFGAGGLIFQNGPEIVAGVFCLFVALSLCLIRDFKVNREVNGR